MRTPKVNYQEGEYKCLPYQLVENAIAEGFEKSLVIYIWLKSKNNFPVYVDFSIRTVAKQIGISPTTLSKHLPILEEKGLIRFDKNNLVCTGTNALLKKFGQKKQTLVPVKLDLNNKSNQLKYIRYVIIHRNLSYQENAYRGKQEILKLEREDATFKKGEVRKLTKMRANFESKLPNCIPLEKSSRSHMSMSNAKFGALVGLNKEAGQKLQRDLRNLNMLKSKSVFVEQKISGLAVGMLASYNLPSYYRINKGGYLVRQKANVITLSNSRYTKMDTN